MKKYTALFLAAVYLLFGLVPCVFAAQSGLRTGKVNLPSTAI